MIHNDYKERLARFSWNMDAVGNDEALRLINDYRADFGLPKFDLREVLREELLRLERHFDKVSETFRAQREDD